MQENIPILILDSLRILYLLIMKIFLALLLIFSGGTKCVLFAQCPVNNKVFQSGESAVYSISYNLGFIWLHAGWADFRVKKDFFHGKQVFKITSKGETNPGYDWIYKVRDYYESIVDTQTVLPYYFKRDVKEGYYSLNEKYAFDYRNRNIKIQSLEGNKPIKYDTLKIEPCVYDALSAIYFARNIDFSKLKIGDKTNVKMILGDKIYNSHLRFMGTEIIEIPEKRIYSCIKFKVLLIEGTIFKGNEDMTVWVSNDRNRVPIMIEAKILIGSIKAVLTQIEGTLYPFKL